MSLWLSLTIVTTTTNSGAVYERDPVVTPGQGCDNPASLTYVKCSIFGGVLDGSSATNTGQWQDNFQVVIAGSNMYVATAPAAQTGFTGPVSFGNNAINAPSGYMGVQTFPQDQPYDPSVCAAACDAKSAYDTEHGLPSMQNPDVCNFFVAYILYENGNNGVFTCTYYTSSWDASYATNNGQWDGQGNHYTPAYSYGYAKIGAPVNGVALPSTTSSSTTSGTTTSSTTSVTTSVSSSTTSSIAASTSSACALPSAFYIQIANSYASGEYFYPYDGEGDQPFPLGTSQSAEIKFTVDANSFLRILWSASNAKPVYYQGGSSFSSLTSTDSSYTGSTPQGYLPFAVHFQSDDGGACPSLESGSTGHLVPASGDFTDYALCTGYLGVSKNGNLGPCSGGGFLIGGALFPARYIVV